MMTTQQIERTAVGGRRMVGGWIIGCALVTLLLAGWLTMPLPVRPAPVPAAEQPIVGHSTVVTGLVFDGTRYMHAPIAVGTPLEQSIVGRAITVTGLRFDGTRYVHAPIAIGAARAGGGYAVTALVDDGTTYRSAPVQIGGHGDRAAGDAVTP
jgi:hypothetical protein